MRIKIKKRSHPRLTRIRHTPLARLRLPRRHSFLLSYSNHLTAIQSYQRVMPTFDASHPVIPPLLSDAVLDLYDALPDSEKRRHTLESKSS